MLYVTKNREIVYSKKQKKWHATETLVNALITVPKPGMNILGPLRKLSKQQLLLLGMKKNITLAKIVLKKQSDPIVSGFCTIH